MCYRKTHSPSSSGSSRRKEPHMTNLTLGQQVINFGETATVVGFHEKTGDPILFAPGVGKWMVKASKCEPAKDTFIHRDGLVAFY